MRKSAGNRVMACLVTVSLVISRGMGYAQGDESSRLGETVAQCDQCYGTPTSMVSKPGASGYRHITHNERIYERDGIQIVVLFAEGRAVGIKYSARNAILSKEKMEKLIGGNKRGRDWTEPVLSDRREDAFGPTTVLYSSDGGLIEMSIQESTLASEPGSKSTKPSSLRIFSPEAFTPETVATNKALFRAPPAQHRQGSMDGL